MSEDIELFTSIKKSKSSASFAPIKEGFLVKKGHVRHNWKTRWFILYRGEIRYYKNRGDDEPAGTISLIGSSLILSPVNYKKRDCLLQVNCGRSGREFLLQALDKESRDQWGHAIEKQIRLLQKDIQNHLSVQTRSSVAFKKLSLYELDSENTSLDVRDIVLAMQDRQAGLALTTESVDGKICRNVFTGSSVVEWLMSWSFADNRSEGQRIGQDLIQRGFLQPVDNLSLSLFRDQNSVLYRFVTLRQDPQLEPITDQALLSLMTRDISDITRPSKAKPKYDRTFTVCAPEGDFLYTIDTNEFCQKNPLTDKPPLKLVKSQSLSDLHNLSLSSGDEDDENVFDQANEEGDIVLQGFLQKECKSSIRLNWRTRKFILREGSNRITYYTGAKLSKSYNIKNLHNRPSGSIKITNSTIIPIPSEDHFKHIFQIRNDKGKRVRLAATCAEERDQWVRTINDHITKLSLYKPSNGEEM